MRKKALIVFIIVPKNSGLRKYREIALSSLQSSRIVEVRGEDVPFIVNLFQTNGEKAIGLTGEDLYSEYLEDNDANLGIIQRIEWKDPKALYGKPALCLLGSKNKELEDLPKNLTVCISSKYKKLANKFLRTLEDKGFCFKRIYMKGCVEVSCSEGIADLVIDIVYSGSSMDKFGLKIYEKIMESDFLIIGGQNEI